jgi:peroxiredoxin
MPNEKRSLDWFSLFLVGACLALSVLVLFLARQNRQLKATLAEHAHTMTPGAVEFKPGDQVSPITVFADSGEKTNVTFGGGEKKTVLLVFSSTCPACEQTLPVWKKLLADGAAPSIRIVGIQTDRVKATEGSAAVVPQSYPFPVYGYERGKPDPLEKVPYIPCALVVDEQGVVKKAWFGVPTKEQEEELKNELAG